MCVCVCAYVCWIFTAVLHTEYPVSFSCSASSAYCFHICFRGGFILQFSTYSGDMLETKLTLLCRIPSYGVYCHQALWTADVTRFIINEHKTRLLVVTSMWDQQACLVCVARGSHHKMNMAESLSLNVVYAPNFVSIKLNLKLVIIKVASHWDKSKRFTTEGAMFSFITSEWEWNGACIIRAAAVELHRVCGEWGSYLKYVCLILSSIHILLLLFGRNTTQYSVWQT